MGQDTDTVSRLPLVALRGMVAYPGLVAPLGIGRPSSLSALQAAIDANSELVLVTQHAAGQEAPSPDDLFTVGVACKIKAVESHEGQPQKTIIAEGQWRCIIEGYAQTEPHFEVQVRHLADIHEAVPADLSHRVATALETVLIERARAGEQTLVSQASDKASPEFIAMGILDVPVQAKQSFLEERSPLGRHRTALDLLVRELQVSRLAEQLRDTGSEPEQKRREGKLLRNRKEEIEKELSDLGSSDEDLDELRVQLAAAALPEEARAEATRELSRLKTIPHVSPEYVITETYLKWLAELPWSKATETKIDLDAARRILDEDHYDREDVKERIIEQLAVEVLKPGRGVLLCFVGPPGVGKTSFGRSIARATGRVFHRISLGGVRDEAEIRGHRRTYVGALPGRIIRALRTVGVNNPIFMLDELDKLTVGLYGDPAAALFEVLDPEQNVEFEDHYLGVPFDLSRIMFIGTANTLDTIPSSLLDRLEVIEMSGYTDEEKVQIAVRHLVPKQIERNGLTGEQIGIGEDTVRALVSDYTREAGVRSLERSIAALCRKVARELDEAAGDLRNVSPDDLSEMLGAPPHFAGRAEAEVRPGLCNTIGMSPTGAEVLQVEVSRVPGAGKLLVTGRVGDVMRESARIAFTFLQASAERYGLTVEEIRSHDHHLHFPRADVSKEGSGAGLAMLGAFVSASTGKSLPSDVAVLGELTLRGLVLETKQIGDKLSAAQRAGITKVILPERNRKDLAAMQESKAPGLEVVYCTTADEALRELLPEAAPAAK